MPSTVHGTKKVFNRYLLDKLIFMVAQGCLEPKEYVHLCGIFGLRGPSWEIFLEIDVFFPASEISLMQRLHFPLNYNW